MEENADIFIIDAPALIESDIGIGLEELPSLCANHPGVSRVHLDRVFQTRSTDGAWDNSSVSNVFEFATAATTHINGSIRK